VLNFWLRRWRDENEFFEKFEERRLEISRGGFVGVIGVIGGKSISSAHLKHSEMGDLGDSGEFSTFWEFSVNMAEYGRVSKPVTMLVGAEDSVGDCVSKMARKNTLFSCPGLAGACESCSELAVVLVEEVANESLDKASLGISGLA
jgi:hypothetical protein